jgi:hypothetical protein
MDITRKVINVNDILSSQIFRSYMQEIISILLCVSLIYRNIIWIPVEFSTGDGSLYP